MAQKLKVLAIGDSVMWGQGNRDEDKFVTRVCATLAGRGYDPDLIQRAHSGAIVTATPHDLAPPPWGEVPESGPSVLHQCEMREPGLDPSDVGLVLVNGGINDLSAFHIVVGNPFDPDALVDLQRLTRDVFMGRVQQLLLRTLQVYTNAQVVVTGYFPIVSAQTDARQLVQLMKHLPRPIDVPNTLDWIAEHVEDSFIDVAITVEKQRMVEQCDAFLDLSTSILRASVASLSPQFGSRLFFAASAFGAENAFAGPESWLWSGSDDPLHGERVERYAARVAQNPLDWPFYTPIASVCHPNAAGAGAYANAIMSSLDSGGVLQGA